MNVAILKNSICINACVFEELETAKDFLASGVWPEADNVTILPDGFGIGDTYYNAKWEKQKLPDEPITSQTPLT